MPRPPGRPLCLREALSAPRPPSCHSGDQDSCTWPRCRSKLPDQSQSIRSDAEHALVTVHDHGPGIPQEIMDHLFERGKRGERTDGFGLGLHIARRIVESAGGTLSAHNDPTDGGATFSVSIPLQRRSHGEGSSARA